MKSKRLIPVAALAVFVAVPAYAQYTAPASTTAPVSGEIGSPNAPATPWQIDAGLGLVAGTNLNGYDTGFALHVGGYYVDPVDNTRESLLKYGVEYFYANVDGPGSRELDTHFFSADIGWSYRFSKRFEASILGGVGVGVLDANGPGGSADSAAFGYQIRPEITGWITDKVGVSLSYRFLHTVALDDSWGKNPIQHAIEFSVKVRF